MIAKTRNVSEDKIKIKQKLDKMNSRSLEWIYHELSSHPKIYKGQRIPLISISRSDEWYTETIYNYFESLDNPLIIWHKVNKNLLEYLSVEKYYAWALKNPKGTFFLLHSLNLAGVNLGVYCSLEEMREAILRITNSSSISYIVKETDTQTTYPYKIVQRFDIPEKHNYQWQEYFRYAQEKWYEFEKNYIAIKWIKPKDKELIDWVYTYKPKCSSHFLVNYFSPLDNDYKSKYLHIMFSLNLHAGVIFNKTYTQGKNKEKTILVDFREMTVKLLKDAWQNHKLNEKNRNYKISITLPKDTYSKLYELKKNGLKTDKNVVIKAIESLYEELLLGEPLAFESEEIDEYEVLNDSEKRIN
nr:hypothetical protein [Moraxella sp. CTOTU47618]